MGLVIYLEIIWRIGGNLLEIFGKFVGNLWEVGVTLALVTVLGIIG